MKYHIENLNVEYNNSIQSAHCLTGSKMLQDTTDISVNVTLRIFEYNEDELTSVESFERALKDDQRISPDAPSYKELLKKYNPEFLL